MNKTIRNMAILAVGAMALSLPGLAYAADANQPPERMTYQGYLVDGDGNALADTAPANYDVVFRIYNVKQGGASLWAEQQTVTVDNGYFSVMLGEGTDFGNEPGADDEIFLSDVFSGAGIKDRFIGITVSELAGTGGADVEIAPRLRLVTSPYAYTATHARRLTDESGTPNFFKDGSTLKLGAGATTTLTLPDAGGATLVGALTADLAGWGTGLQVDNGNHSTTFGGTDLNAFNLSTSLARFSFNKPLEVSSISFSPFAGLEATSGTYGSVMTTGSGSNGNEGYSIGGRYNFMTGVESDRYVGTYNDLDDEWLWLYDRTLDRHIWHSDGGQGRLTLSPDGLKVEEDLVVKGWLLRGSDGTGGLVGGHGQGGAWNNDTTNPIFVLGSGYKPSEKNLDGMYGIGYGNPQANFITGNAHEWGLYVAGAGTANAFISGYAPSGRSYIKCRRGGLGVGTDSPDNYAALTVVGDNGTLGWNTWPRSIYVKNSADTLGTVMGPGTLFMGMHKSDNRIFFGQASASAYFGWIGSGGWTDLSDAMLKEDIQPIPSPLDQLEKVRGVNFKWKNRDQRSYGVIAQEVEKEFPEVVSEGEDGIKGVAYNKLTPILLEGLKELRREKDEQLAQKEERISDLEERLAKLEELMGNMGQGL